jgi:hypothetical protein
MNQSQEIARDLHEFKYLTRRLDEYASTCTNWEYGRWLAAPDEFFVIHAKNLDALFAFIKDYGAEPRRTPVMHVPEKKVTLIL